MLTPFKHCMIASACAAFVPMTAAFAIPAEHASSPLLFTQIARSVDIEPCQNKTQCDFHITLRDLKSDETTYFSDRPKHFTGEVTVADFVKNWPNGSDSFRKDPPNASFVYFDHQEKITQTIVKLMRPQFDQQNNTLSYDVKEISKIKVQPGQYQHAILFVDTASGCWNEWGGCG